MIVCTGSVAIDTTRTPFGNAERILGGSASYFSVSASKFHETSVCAVVGEEFPSEHEKFLSANGVSLAGLKKIRGGKTFFFDSSFSYDMNVRTAIKTELNVLATHEPELPANLKKSEYVYLGSTVPSKQLHFLKEVENPKLSFLDTIEYFIQHDRVEVLKVLKEVHGVVLNDVEARMLCSTPNLIKCGKMIHDLGPEIVILKKAENGCILFFAGGVFPFTAYPLETVVDPTGAGDSFAGGFVGSLAAMGGKLTQANLKKAVAYGTVMASFCIEDFGLRKLSGITGKDIEGRVKEFSALSSF